MYELLFKLGFILIITDENLMVIHYMKGRPPTNFQWKTLKDASLQSGLILFDDVTNKTIKLNESSVKGVNRVINVYL